MKLPSKLVTKNRRYAILIMIALTGLIVTLIAAASVYSISIESESLQGTFSQQSLRKTGDSTASDGSYVQFGAITQPPTGTYWKPAVGISWQWQITGAIDTNVSAEVFDIDLFDAKDGDISALKAKKNYLLFFRPL